jgi:hypothetical protein
MSWDILGVAAPWNDLNDVPVHLRGQVKRARDARLYAGITIPKVGDLVSINYGWHPGQPALVTKVDTPTVWFTYPDGKEGTSGVRGVKLVQFKDGSKPPIDRRD